MYLYIYIYIYIELNHLLLSLRTLKVARRIAVRSLLVEDVYATTPSHGAQ